MRPDDPRHGTEAGNEQHARDGEQPCDPCYQAKLIATRRRTKRKTMGHRYTMPLGPRIHSKITTLLERGSTLSEIADWAGISDSQLHRALKNGPDGIVYTRTWHKLDQFTPGRILTPTGITRRIQALHTLGYSSAVIATHAGVCVETIQLASKQPRGAVTNAVADAVADVYEVLSMRPNTPTERYARMSATRARATAKKRGWASPLCWDDATIDDPNARPRGSATGDRRRLHGFDPAVVDRILGGEWRLPATREERVHVTELWRSQGVSRNEVERRTGWNVRRDARLEDGGEAA